MNKTPNYQLNQWEAEDRVLRTDFNADNAKIDAALGALEAKADAKADASVLETLGYTIGFYQGTGTPQHISLPFTPRAVFAVCRGDTFASSGSIHLPSWAMLAVAGGPEGSVKLEEGGFLAQGNLNDAKCAYAYIAWK